MASAVPRDPTEKMNFWYSSEKWKEGLAADEAETICVPPCLDVLKSWIRNDPAESSTSASYILGQKGEAAFMEKFKKLKLGGILVSGLKSSDLVASHIVPKEMIQNGEWDAIFFHQKRGIFVIEVKATKTDDEEAVKRPFSDAKTQLDRNIENIKQSFLSLYQKECNCITGYICFPFRNDNYKTYEGYRVIDKSALNNRDILKKFFEPRTEETMTEVSLLQSFGAELVCCRSQVTFHSQAYNAMQVATWIIEHNVGKNQDKKNLKKNIPGNGPSGKIILTKEQLEIVECREKCVTIYGAPGSGKTLIVMLRALEAAMENKAGSVFVFVNEKLKAKYERYFFEETNKIAVDNAKNIDRMPKVHTIDKINFAKPEDDVFCDETPVEDSYIQKIESRVGCSGSTTVVFTGLHKPVDAVASFRLHQPQLKQFKIFKMMKVLRGTENVFGEWVKYYNHGFSVGHCINGVGVNRDTFDSFEQVQNKIADEIDKLKGKENSSTTLPSLKKEHIAVITCDDNDLNEMRNYLKTKDIPSGQVNVQARELTRNGQDTSIVAVDEYLNTPSYEWPIVFIVLKPGFTKKAVLPIAASRCIASLFIFTYKYALKQSLKEMHLTRFQKVYPLSLHFTFDIEKTWVSLALKEDDKKSQAAEDHAKLLQATFEKAKMLIIEGDPATGKTSLMRRLAYEWANGKQELLHYDLVLYAEFRKVREKAFESIAELVLCYSKTYLSKENYELLEKLMNNELICKEKRILVLLDGYDESSLEKQCLELKTYLFQSITDKALVFNVVITTRKGYLSNLKGREGRFVFAEVLGFTTRQQKEKYIYNHFLSSETDNKDNIAAVHSLLNNNRNLNKLAEIPLFLTFICLVHERIIVGTLVELYCNIIWWLIDRHQQDFPDRDIPALFGFRTDSSDKFETIQEHFLHFPQLHCLGNMALHNLEENVFTPSDCAQFNLQPVIEQVGFLRKERNHDKSFKIITSFFFPHRTIQEFFAAFYCFCSNDPTSEWLAVRSFSTPLGMNEFERFLFRIALFDKIPIQAEKRKYYFERVTDIGIDITFDELDAFITTAGFNSKLFNWFLSQCTNVQKIFMYDQKREGHARNMLNDWSYHNESAVTSGTSSLALFSFCHLSHLHSIEFSKCIFEANSKLSFTNCPSLKNLQFTGCDVKSSTNLRFATLPAIVKIDFSVCTFESNPQLSFSDLIELPKLAFTGCTFLAHSLLSFTNCPSLNMLLFLMCEMETITIIGIATLLSIDTVLFRECSFLASSQLSFINWPSLGKLKFYERKIKSSTKLRVATLSTFDTVQFDECDIDLATWQSITDQIRDSSVKCLQLSADFFVKETYPRYLHSLQKCERIQQIHVYDNILKRLNLNEESVTASLAQTAEKIPELRSITFSDEYGNPLDESRRMSEEKRKRIEEAGRKRNPHFSIIYVEHSEQEE